MIRKICFSFVVLLVVSVALINPTFAHGTHPHNTREQLSEVQIQSRIVKAQPIKNKLKGENVGDINSFSANFDFSGIDPTAEFTQITLSFNQKYQGGGLVKILDQRTTELLESIALSSSGKKTTERIDTTVEKWVENPESNFGLFFQAIDLETDSVIVIDNMKISVSYYIPDTTSPAITALNSEVLINGDVRITWETDEDAIAIVKYGKTSDYNYKTNKTTEFATEGEFILTDLVEGLTYHYLLLVVDSSENYNDSDDRVFTVNLNSSIGPISEQINVVSAPKLLNIELSLDQLSVNLAWSKSTTDEIDGYKVYRSKGNTDNFEEITKTEAGTTSFTDIDVADNGKYFYYVTAYRGTSESSHSPIKKIAIPELTAQVLGASSLLDNSSPQMVAVAIGICLFILGFGYFYSKKVIHRIQLYREKSSERKLKNILHDPNYYFNDYESSVLEKENGESPL